MTEFVTQDSGQREEFETGSRRDTRTGKGRFDLLPVVAIRRLAQVYERGSDKYGERNWELGQPLTRYMDSALRHVFDYAEGKRDEDHMGQAIFNLAAIIHTEEMIKRGLLPAELNNLRSYLPAPEANEGTHDGTMKEDTETHLDLHEIFSVAIDSGRSLPRVF